MLRSAILDAAAERAGSMSWSQVRVSDLADDVGVSRQTIHNEFGAKEMLALALFEREMDGFAVGLQEQIDAASSPQEATRAALNWVLDTAREHRLLQRMAADAREGSSDGLVPVLTVQADDIVRPARDRVVRLMAQRWPELDPQHTAVVAEFAVRLVLWQLVSPSGLSESALIDAVVSLMSDVRP